MGSWGLEIWVLSTSLQKSNIGWPQQPLTKRLPKRNHEHWKAVLASNSLLWNTISLAENGRVTTYQLSIIYLFPLQSFDRVWSTFCRYRPVPNRGAAPPLDGALPLQTRTLHCKLCSPTEKYQKLLLAISAKVTWFGKVTTKGATLSLEQVLAKL